MAGVAGWSPQAVLRCIQGTAPQGDLGQLCRQSHVEDVAGPALPGEGWGSPMGPLSPPQGERMTGAVR